MKPEAPYKGWPTLQSVYSTVVELETFRIHAFF